MTTRQTSIEVYRQIEAEGLLSRMRLEVYSALFRIGPATAAEIARELLKGGASPHGGRGGPGNVGARLVELCELGVAQEVGERVCQVTGRNVLLWDVTNNLPSGRVEKKDTVSRPKPEVMRDALQDLRELIRLAKKSGYVPSSALVALGRWLAAKYEDGS